MQTLEHHAHEARKVLFRKKGGAHEFSKLNKVLNLLDVTFLSIGTTLGVGPYIFIGHYAHSIGPAMTLAYLIAAVIAFLSAGCYAELTSRGGGSGGAYTCAYMFIGELPAAVVGWLLVLQNIIGSALSVRAVSDLIDYWTIHGVSSFIKENILEFHSPLLGEYPDLVSFCVSFIILTVLTFGLKEVSIINNILVAFNITLMVMIFLVTGSIIDWNNWSLPAKEGCGDGGYMPFGLISVWRGGGSVLYTFLGFDAAIHAAAECLDPDRIIPISLIMSCSIVFILYLLQSVAYTLTWSYCDQNLESPINYVLEKTGIPNMSWMSNIGIPVALMGSILSSKFPLSRVLYAMAEDGIFYSYMAKLKLRTGVPVNALYTSGLLTGICAALFNKNQLAELNCLATLLSYSIIAVMVIYLRYTDPNMEEPRSKSLCAMILNIRPKELFPTKITSRIVGICCWLILLASYPFLLLISYGGEEIFGRTVVYIICICLAVSFYVAVSIIICCQPMSEQNLAFKVRFVPFLPMVSVFLNSYMSLTYDFYTWIRLVIFVGLGTFVYVTYGIWNSKLRETRDKFY